MCVCMRVRVHVCVYVCVCVCVCVCHTADDTVPRTPDAQYAHFKAQIDKTITLLLPELGKMVSFDLGQDSVTKMLREYLDMLQEERLELLNAYLRDKKDAEFEARARARAAEEKVRVYTHKHKHTHTEAWRSRECSARHS